MGGSSSSSGYGAPDSGYGAPDSGYGAPNSGYNAPNSGYNAPNSGYGAPGQSSGYNAPNSGYNAPNNNLGGGGLASKNEIFGQDFGFIGRLSLPLFNAVITLVNFALGNILKFVYFHASVALDSFGVHV